MIIEYHHFTTSNEIMDQSKWFPVAAKGLGDYDFIMNESAWETSIHQELLAWQQRQPSFRNLLL